MAFSVPEGWVRFLAFKLLEDWVRFLACSGSQKKGSRLRLSRRLGPVHGVQGARRLGPVHGVQRARRLGSVHGVQGAIRLGPGHGVQGARRLRPVPGVQRARRLGPNGRNIRTKVASNWPIWLRAQAAALTYTTHVEGIATKLSCLTKLTELGLQLCRNQVMWCLLCIMFIVGSANLLNKIKTRKKAWRLY